MFANSFVSVTSKLGDNILDEISKSKKPKSDKILNYSLG